MGREPDSGPYIVSTFQKTVDSLPDNVIVEAIYKESRWRFVAKFTPPTSRAEYLLPSGCRKPPEEETIFTGYNLADFAAWAEGFNRGLTSGYQTAYVDSDEKHGSHWIEAMGMVHARACPSKQVDPDHPLKMAESVVGVIDHLREAVGKGPVEERAIGITIAADYCKARSADLNRRAESAGSVGERNVLVDAAVEWDHAAKSLFANAKAMRAIIGQPEAPE